MGTKPHWSPQEREPLTAGNIRLFALGATATLGGAVAAALRLPVAAHEERAFEDGEFKVRPLDSVAGADAYVMHNLDGDPEMSASDKLCRLLFFVGALKDAGAARVTAVAPYLCFSRKDRRTKPQDPVTTRYVAAMFEAVGTDTVVTLEVHNPAASENAFRCRTVSLTTTPLFVDYARMLTDGPISIVSPDAGGAKRAALLREALQEALGRPIGNAFAEKRRSAGKVSGELFVGEVADATALIVDDLVSTGTTLVRAARAARQAGARRVLALVTHGLFSEGAAEALADPALDRLVVTDTAAPFRLAAGPVRDKLEILPAAPLLAAAIRRLHLGQSVSDLLAF